MIQDCPMVTYPYDEPNGMNDVSIQDDSIDKKIMPFKFEKKLGSYHDVAAVFVNREGKDFDKDNDDIYPGLQREIFLVACRQITKQSHTNS